MRSGLRWFLRGVSVAIVLLVVYFVITLVQVWSASGRDDTSPVDAIIVMGAAQWDGKPSPVFKARLDHAAKLFHGGVGQTVIVTGGKQEGDDVTQGFVGLEYLLALGVPESSIKVEVGGTNSYEELAASALILSEAGIGKSVVLVSDPYHSLRITGIASEVGLDGQTSPTEVGAPFRSYMREAVAVGLGRIVGYRRLAAIS